jgi:hypothetical protein
MGFFGLFKRGRNSPIEFCHSKVNFVNRMMNDKIDIALG